MDFSQGKELSIIAEQVGLLHQSVIQSMLALNQMQKDAAKLHFLTAFKAAVTVKTMFDDLARQIQEAESNRV